VKSIFEKEFFFLIVACSRAAMPSLRYQRRGAIENTQRFSNRPICIRFSHRLRFRLDIDARIILNIRSDVRTREYSTWKNLGRPPSFRAVAFRNESIDDGERMLNRDAKKDKKFEKRRRKGTPFARMECERARTVGLFSFRYGKQLTPVLYSLGDDEEGGAVRGAVLRVWLRSQE
jgi:hypothetical protein